MVNQHLPDLFRMFYPLSGAEQRHWAELLSLPDDEYVSALNEEALERGLQQETLDDAVAWSDVEGPQLMLLFRVSNPRDLSAVRKVYDTIAANQAPLAYTFVNQVPDGPDTWDIFHMSKLTYLAHCNRVAGPGSGDDQ
ncbi:MAG: hypothetical protein M8866_07960 [marine benthic group bacterium]|nr:hypothetical protein [Candidatus Benthicola marisminoris]